MAERPNILLICADQWRGDSLSAMGHPHAKTPHLDALAADGVLFENHFGQTTPCGPSRTSLLTGLYLMNHRSGRNGTPLDRRHTNLALEARRAGYEPALFGYTDTTPDPRGHDPADPALTGYDRGVMPGFTTPLHLPDDMGPWVADLIAKGYDFSGREDVFRPQPGAQPAGKGFRYRPTLFKAGDDETSFVTNAFLKWLLVREKTPWFAHLVFYRPHPPLIAPEPFNALVDPADVAMPARATTPEAEAAQHPFLGYAIDRLRRPGAYDEGSPLDIVAADDLEIRQMRAAYFGLVAAVDEQIGRVVAQLQRTGQYERTLIIVTSDHGEMLGEHFTWGKEVYFDPAFHLPLVIRDPRPGAVRGRRVSAMTEAIDVMPTILDWLGQTVPRSCDGRSLLPFLDGEEPADWRQHVFFEHDFRDVRGQGAEQALDIASDAACYAAIRGKRWKYVHFAALPPLLFDLESDPDELHDRAADPACCDVLLDCAQKMLDWRLSAGERTLTNMHAGPGGIFSRP